MTRLRHGGSFRALPVASPTIVARIRDGRVVLDPRTLTEDESDAVLTRLAAIAGE